MLFPSNILYIGSQDLLIRLWYVVKAPDVGISGRKPVKDVIASAISDLWFGSAKLGFVLIRKAAGEVFQLLC